MDQFFSRKKTKRGGWGPREIWKKTRLFPGFFLRTPSLTQIWSLHSRAWSHGFYSFDFVILNLVMMALAYLLLLWCMLANKESHHLLEKAVAADGWDETAAMITMITLIITFFIIFLQNILPLTPFEAACWQLHWVLSASKEKHPKVPSSLWLSLTACLPQNSDNLGNVDQCQCNDELLFFRRRPFGECRPSPPTAQSGFGPKIPEQPFSSPGVGREGGIQLETSSNWVQDGIGVILSHWWVHQSGLSALYRSSQTRHLSSTGK